MANKKKTPRGSVHQNEVINRVVKDIRDLMEAHYSEIETFIDESEAKKATVNFGAVIDQSESAPSMKTSIRFSQSVTDTRTSTLDDPAQVPMPFVPEVDGRAPKKDARAAKRKRSGKESAAGDDDAEGHQEDAPSEEHEKN